MAPAKNTDQAPVPHQQTAAYELRNALVHMAKVPGNQTR